MPALSSHAKRQQQMKIQLSDLTRSFGSVPVLDHASVEFRSGSIVALLGANGSGKTTLLRCLSGILCPDGVEMRFDGELFSRDRIDLRRRTFFLPDFPAVFPEMTLIEHIEMVLQLYECDALGVEDRVVQLLTEFDLLPLVDCPIGTVSRGQSYKASLAAFLAVDPELWLLDEPFAAGMDPRGLTAFRQHCQSAVTRGRTIIYSTQLIEVVDGFANQVCVAANGGISSFPNVSAFLAALGDQHSDVAELFRHSKTDWK